MTTKIAAAKPNSKPPRITPAGNRPKSVPPEVRGGMPSQANTRKPKLFVVSVVGEGVNILDNVATDGRAARLGLPFTTPEATVAEAFSRGLRSFEMMCDDLASSGGTVTARRLSDTLARELLLGAEEEESRHGVFELHFDPAMAARFIRAAFDKIEQDAYNADMPLVTPRDFFADVMSDGFLDVGRAMYGALYQRTFHAVEILAQPSARDLIAAMTGVGEMRP